MKLLKILWILGYGLTVLSYPVAGILGAGAVEVQMITPHAPEIVDFNKAEFGLAPPDAKKDPKRVIQIYGNATGEPVEVLFIDETQLLHPEEMKDLVLLPVDKQKGEDPVQYQMVLFFAWYTTVCSAIGSTVLLVLWCVLRSRKKAAPPAPSA